MNYTTKTLTKNQYTTIMYLLNNGKSGFSAKPKIAFALYLEAHLGIRIGDVLRLKLSDFIANGCDYRLNIKELKTSKKRNHPIPAKVYFSVIEYCKKYKLTETEYMFDFTNHTVNYNLRQISTILKLKDINTHSFRKMFATECYTLSGKDIVAVQQIMQHSSASVTQRYIGVPSELIENTLRQICFA
jgi:integrase